MIGASVFVRCKRHGKTYVFIKSLCKWAIENHRRCRQRRTLARICTRCLFQFFAAMHNSYSILIELQKSTCNAVDSLFYCRNENLIWNSTERRQKVSGIRTCDNDSLLLKNRYANEIEWIHRAATMMMAIACGHVDLRRDGMCSCWWAFKQT